MSGVSSRHHWPRHAANESKLPGQVGVSRTRRFLGRLLWISRGRPGGVDRCQCQGTHPQRGHIDN
jgi:hypothetical protein